MQDSEQIVMLPSQFFDLSRSRTESGEIRLILAVLIDAVNTLVGPKGTKSGKQIRKRFGETVGWVEKSWGPFGFESICENLDIEPSVFRKALEPYMYHNKEGQVMRFQGPYKRSLELRARKARKREPSSNLYSGAADRRQAVSPSAERHVRPRGGPGHAANS